MTIGKPTRNRVSPLGDIIATPGRGAGWATAVVCTKAAALATSCATISTRRGSTVPCRFGAGGWPWNPTAIRPLFFLDEAVALSAGHRPCAECRHSAYREYRRLWAQTTVAQCLMPRIWNAQLHRERPGDHRAPGADCPMACRRVRLRTRPSSSVTDLWCGFETTTSIGQAGTPQCGDATVFTPPSTVEILRAGYAGADR